MSIFEFDHTLPALPVADLPDICENLKVMIKPLVDDIAWQETCHALDLFCNGGSGSSLQELLIKNRSSLHGNASWLRPIWDDMYLANRDMLPINMNYTFELIASKWGEHALPLLVGALAHTLRSLRDETLPVETSRTGTLSMDTLRYIIYTRTPSTVRDSWYYPSLANPMTASVVCKGNWFILSLEDSAGEILPPSSIEQALKHIREQAQTLPASTCVGALTAAKRGDSHTLRTSLQQNILNRISLESIEKTLFTICLDSTDDTMFEASLIAGDAANRWFDKSLQICSNGSRLGMNIEHSGCDAGIWVYLLTQADAFIEDGTVAVGVEAQPAHFRLLNWNITDTLASELQLARDTLVNLVGSISFTQRRVSCVSRTILKPKKCSPDWFVQMLIQMAYYTQTKRVRSIYEAVSTRNFYQGRTECVRPVTEESTALVLAYVNGAGDEELRQKFRLAEQAHMRSIERCQQALGSERHMSGLQYMYLMYAGTPMGENLTAPAVFDTEGYRALKYDAVSTSSTTAPFIDFFGFGPVVSDGIGIGYGLKQDALHLMISAYDKSGIKPEAFLDALENAAARMLAVL